MVRRLGFLLVVLGALALVPVAVAAYPTPYAAQDASLFSLDHSVRYVAHKQGKNTLLKAVSASDGAITMSQTITGSFGIPILTQRGLAGGLFHDGSAFVLQNMGVLSRSTFQIVDAGDLGVRDTISLKGTFGFDALSPDATKLLLIQHMSTQDVEHYVVRAYDLQAHMLLPGRIADKTQKSWVMQGLSVSRAVSPDGRWAYTLYANPGGYPFIHALDTVRGIAHCIGLPWKRADQAPVYNFTLTLKGHTIGVHWSDGSVWRRVDTRSWRVSA